MATKVLDGQADAWREVVGGRLVELCAADAELAKLRLRDAEQRRALQGKDEEIQRLQAQVQQLTECVEIAAGTPTTASLGFHLKDFSSVSVVSVGSKECAEMGSAVMGHHGYEDSLPERATPSYRCCCPAQDRVAELAEELRDLRSAFDRVEEDLRAAQLEADDLQASLAQRDAVAEEATAEVESGAEKLREAQESLDFVHEELALLRERFEEREQELCGAQAELQHLRGAAAVLSSAAEAEVARAETELMELLELLEAPSAQGQPDTSPLQREAAGARSPPASPMSPPLQCSNELLFSGSRRFSRSGLFAALAFDGTAPAGCVAGTGALGYLLDRLRPAVQGVLQRVLERTQEAEHLGQQVLAQQLQAEAARDAEQRQHQRQSVQVERQQDQLQQIRSQHQELLQERTEPHHSGLAPVPSTAAVEEAEALRRALCQAEASCRRREGEQRLLEERLAAASDAAARQAAAAQAATEKLATCKYELALSGTDVEQSKAELDEMGRELGTLTEELESAKGESAELRLALQGRAAQCKHLAGEEADVKRRLEQAERELWAAEAEAATLYHVAANNHTDHDDDRLEEVQREHRQAEAALQEALGALRCRGQELAASEAARLEQQHGGAAEVAALLAAAARCREELSQGERALMEAESGRRVAHSELVQKDLELGRLHGELARLHGARLCGEAPPLSTAAARSAGTIKAAGASAAGLPRQRGAAGDESRSPACRSGAGQLLRAAEASAHGDSPSSAAPSAASFAAELPGSLAEWRRPSSRPPGGAATVRELRCPPIEVQEEIPFWELDPSPAASPSWRPP